MAVQGGARGVVPPPDECYALHAMSEARNTFPVVLRPGDDGWIVAECPTLEGCISQGRTREEALANIREAIELCLESGDGPRGEIVKVTVAA